MSVIAFMLGMWLLRETMDRLLPEYLVMGLEANEDGAKGWSVSPALLVRGKSWHTLKAGTAVGRWNSRLSAEQYVRVSNISEWNTLIGKCWEITDRLNEKENLVYGF